MKKLGGLFLFLLLLYAALLAADPGARTLQNHLNLANRIGLYGVMSLGAGILIISGGIDLSIGSVVGLCATATAMLLVDLQWPPALALPAVLALGAGIGLVNGLLVTQLRVQAFVVTLCGLFVYRGIARWIADDLVQGLGSSHKVLKEALAGNLLGVPTFLWIFVLLSVAAAVFLHFSVYGRYLFAIGSNERAAKYSGIATNRYKLLAYVLCSILAAFAGILFLMEQNSAQPSQAGNFFELYAIAGAVLGGCSLRGGEGNVAGIAIGVTILWILPNLTKMAGVETALEPTVVGAALLIGAVLDELLRRRAATRRTA